MNQQGHILTFPFQVTGPLTFLLAKDPPRVSPWVSLKASEGDLLMNLLLFFSLLPFLSTGSSILLSIFGIGVTLIVGVGAVKTDGSLSSKLPKWTCSMIDLNSRMESLTLLQDVAVMHSSNHNWLRALIVYMNLLQSSLLVSSRALRDCLHFFNVGGECIDCLRGIAILTKNHLAQPSKLGKLLHHVKVSGWGVYLLLVQGFFSSTD